MGGYIMVEQNVQEKYAELALKTGVNLQKGQALMIRSTIESADFTRIVVRKAYELGAKDVHVNWSDDELTLLKYKHAPDEVLSHFPDWQEIGRASCRERVKIRGGARYLKGKNT